MHPPKWKSYRKTIFKMAQKTSKDNKSLHNMEYLQVISSCLAQYQFVALWVKICYLTYFLFVLLSLKNSLVLYILALLFQTYDLAIPSMNMRLQLFAIGLQYIC